MVHSWFVFVYVSSCAAAVLSLVPSVNHGDLQAAYRSNTASGAFLAMYQSSQLTSTKPALATPLRRTRDETEDALDPFGFLSDPSSASDTRNSVTASSTQSKSVDKHTSGNAATVTSNSIIGTPGPVPSNGPSVVTQTTSTALLQTTSNAISSTSSPTAVVGQGESPAESSSATSSASDSAALSEWKIIGVAVIAFSAVATVILGVVFFDQWWSEFLRPMLWKKMRINVGAEEMMPDWDKRSWRIGIEEKNDRYPSIASFPSVFKLNNAAATPEEYDRRPLSPFPARTNFEMRGPCSDELLTSTTAPAAAQIIGTAPPRYRMSISAPHLRKDAAFGTDSPEMTEEDAYGGVANEDVNPYQPSQSPST